MWRLRGKITQISESAVLAGVADLNQWCRYLTAINQLYYDSLSSASQKSLAFQGGPFRGEELKVFEQDLLKDEMVSLRLWDDAAKVVGIEDSTPRARDYLEMMVAHLSGNTSEN
jgi:predicted HD phosphohydrolase